MSSSDSDLTSWDSHAACTAVGYSSAVQSFSSISNLSDSYGSDDEYSSMSGRTSVQSTGSGMTSTATIASRSGHRPVDLLDPIAEDVGKSGRQQMNSSSSSSSASVETSRHFLVNGDNSEYKFTSNKIKTSHYTMWNFIFKNLWEQFHKTANIYFLVIALIQLVPGLSPVNPWSSISPLVFVLGTTAIKEAIEDVRRHRTDKTLNSRETKRVNPKTGEVEDVAWANIVVGDVVFLRDGDSVPADMILLSSVEKTGIAYVDTATLDGETNLKQLTSVQATRGFQTAADVAALRMTCDTEEPNVRIYKFEGNIRLDGADETHPVTAKEVLLRGMVLRNSAFVFGAVVFTGHDTKQMRNIDVLKSVKRSRLDRQMNRYLFFIFGILICLILGSAVAGGFLRHNIGQTHPYLGIVSPTVGESMFEAFKSMFTFLVLYGTLIPISLYVSVEIVKVSHAILVHWDKDLYHKKTETSAQARTSNLSEELGQIQYVFSDKTGTLTSNVMKFSSCSIAGKMYGSTLVRQNRETGDVFDEAERRVTDSSNESSSDDGQYVYLSKLIKDMDRGENRHNIRLFLTVLAVCHTVIPSYPDASTSEGAGDDAIDIKRIVYQASSPDEGALVTAARTFGYSFHTRTPKYIEIRNPLGLDVRYEVLNVLEFSSDRKRMSVIVRSREGRIMLLCKGADSVINGLIRPSPIFNATQEHLDEFAASGLRTLSIAYRFLRPSEYEEWAALYHKATIAKKHREEKIAQVAAQIEVNLTLIGCTAIEDKLQDGVPRTISDLRTAGIKIWVLTGDKQATAINIGFASRLLVHGMELRVANGRSADALKRTLSKHLDGARSGPASVDVKQQALVMDGESLAIVLEDAALAQQLYEIGQLCAVVLFCRVSPKQKADVVRLVISRSNVRSLAIGDGANDVAMIRAAHVGVGISGHEGLQAVLASDYAFAQFRFLRKLLLVHGRWSYIRISKLVLYSFYKNFAFNLCQFWFNWWAMFSGQTVIDDWYISTYNLFFTGLPVMLYAVFDKDISARACLLFPQLYRAGIERKEFNRRLFGLWCLEGALQSVVLFYFPFMWYHSTSAHSNGRFSGLDFMGSVIYAGVVVTANVKLCLMTLTFNWINSLFLVLHLVGWYGFALVYHNVEAFGTVFAIGEQFASPSFWLVHVVTVTICHVPGILFFVIRENYFPTLKDVVRRLRIPEDLDIPLRSLKSAPSIKSLLLRFNSSESAVSEELGLSAEERAEERPLSSSAALDELRRRRGAGSNSGSASSPTSWSST